MSNELNKPRRNDAVVVNDDPDAPSLLNPLNGEIFVTNKVGLAIMALADGEKTVEEIVAAISAQFLGAPKDLISQDVENFLKTSTEKELIEWV